MELAGLTPATLKLHRQTFHYLLAASLDLESFNSPDLLGMFAASFPPAWKSSTAKAHLQRLATFGNWLCRLHHTNTRHRGPSLSRRPMHRPLPTAEETRRILSKLCERAAMATPGRARTRQQDYLLVRVLSETGARISEALALCVDDVIADPRGACLVIRGTKSEAAERAVIVSDELVADLRAFRARWHIARGRIFRSRTRRVLRGEDFTRWLSEFCRSIDVHCHVTAHTFRYAYILGQIEQGKSAIEVMTRIGHSDIEMTVY